MPKIPKNDLFLLVKSLQTDEKKYIRRFIGRRSGQENTQAETLLDALLQSDTYDEGKLCGMLPASLVKNLAYEKHRLMDLLVLALRTYHESKRKDLQARNLLVEAKLLQERGLYEYSVKRLNKARALAVTYEMNLILLEVNELLRFVEKRNLSLETEDRLETLDHEARALIRMVESQFSYRSLADSLQREARQKARARGKQDLNLLAQLRASKLLEAEPDNGSFESRKLYWVSKALLAQLDNKTEEFRDHYAQVVNLWEAHPHLMATRRIDYKTNLANYLQACHSARDYRPFPYTLEKLRSMPAQSEEERIEDFQNITILEFLAAMNKPDFQRAGELVLELEIGLGKYGPQLPQSRFINIYYNMAIFNFVRNEPREALLAIAPILDIRRSAHRRDIRNFCRVFEILLYFESGQDKFVRQFFQVNYNQLKRAQRLFQFEKVVLSGLKGMDPVGNPLNHKRFEKLLHQMEELQENPIERRATGFMEVLLYTTAKVKRQGMEEILRNWIQAGK